MKKFRLYVVKAGYRDESKFETVKGFKDAEEKAKELLAAAWKDYPDSDTYVDCVEHDYELQMDHLVMVRDYEGELYWRKMVFGSYCPLYSRFLDEDEESELQEWRDEKEVFVKDLSHDKLIKLRQQVCVGSCYLSDYENEFGVDENTVCSLCDGYSNWLEEEGLEDTGEEFAYYIKEVV